MIIALASPCIASALDEGLDKIKRLLSEASAHGAEIVCFPEAYLPGLRGHDFEVLPFDQTEQERALHAVAQWAQTYAVAAILGMERLTEAGRQIVAFVIDAGGHIQGYQTKNQLDPTEDQFYIPGSTRRLFEIKGIKFGVVICHEGWRYPETVRWAAVRGAKIVFHPHHTGSDREGARLSQWGAAGGPYYEKAMMMRSIENTIYFASVNYALRYQESATSLITPSGQCQAYLPYGREGVLVQAIRVEEATGLLATRYAPERYQESQVSTNLISMPDSTLQIAAAPPDSEDAVDLIRALDDDLRGRYPGIAPHGLHPNDARDRRLVFLIARADGRSIGCGAVRELEASVGEVKRMFVQPAWRRRGVARQLLAALESQARNLGYTALRLETAVGQPEAIGLYRSAGYIEIPPFGEHLKSRVSVCFEKPLT